MERLKELEYDLDEIKKRMDNQLVNFNDDSENASKRLIEIVSKNPENKELIEFIVRLTDKAETNHDLLLSTVMENLNSFLNIKKEIIRKMKKGVDRSHSTIEQPKKSFFVKFFISFPKAIRDFKIVFISLAIIGLALVVFFDPDTFLKIISALLKLFI